MVSDVNPHPYNAEQSGFVETGDVLVGIGLPDGEVGGRCKLTVYV